MRLKTVIAFNIVLFVSVVAMGLYQWKFEQQQLAGTRWACVQLDEGFVTQGYSGYQEIADRSILEFTSDNTLLIFQKGHFTTETSGPHPYEVYFEADYTADNGRLSVAYHHIDWDLKPADSGSLVRDMDALVRAKIELMYKVKGEHLFLFSKGHAEERNYACYKK
ncbi:hypothetical protein [Vibrio pelagius]|uniref:hypothetical protein n=1 Tax=Vibrio pelagius TaxID=28169 RepID=UPI003551319A